MVFPVVLYGCESWTIKKAEHQRIHAFKLWGLEKTLESPLDSMAIKPVHPKGNQPWIFIGRTDAEAEAPILWPSDAKSWLKGRRERWWWRVRMLDGITDLMDTRLRKFQEIRKDREAWNTAVHGITKSQTQLSNWMKQQIYKAEIETQTERTNWWIPWGKARGGMNWKIGTVIYTLLIVCIN